MVLLGLLNLRSPAFSANVAPNQRAFTTKERSHWAFQAIRSPAVPQAGAAEPIQSPVDVFVLRYLQDRGLTFSNPASKTELIRRAKFDLLGLPPTPVEIDRFLADPSPNAYERVLDRFLADPHYGETWGRRWLDLVRYAETAGYNADPTRPLAWKYRDYVVRAFNEDIPYDRFIQEQIAGDELFPQSAEAQIATGYTRMWPDESNASVVALARQDALNDLTGNIGSVFLGLSIGCAECHDHKFDPIRQHDFYRLQAFFSAIVPVERVPVGSSDALADYQHRLDAWLAETSTTRHELHRLVAAARSKAGRERRKRFPAAVLAAIDKPIEERTALERQLFFWSDRQITLTEKDVLAQMNEKDRIRLPELRRKAAELEATRPQPPAAVTALSTIEVSGPIPSTFLLAGGSYDKPVREVRPGFLSVLFREPEPVAAIVPSRRGGSGRRSALARWLSDPQNPLVARVLVNRVWQGHMGRGLVSNANDFGTQTPPPSHPQLLDWLASDFVAQGWSLKHLHRLIMTSAVYRQSTVRRKAVEAVSPAVQIDKDNNLYWQFGRRRLTAEQIRDALLAVSGRLNETMEGPSIRPPLPESFPKIASWKVTPSPHHRDRRSIYIFAKRNLPFPLLKAFDLPDMHESCARRPATIIAPQALALFNSPFAVECADSMAQRILQDKTVATDWTSRIDQAYRIALGRSPQAAEIVEGRRFLRAQADQIPQENNRIADDGTNDAEEPEQRTAFADLCHALLNTNEFLFIE
jgi:hypothetical protein